MAIAAIRNQLILHTTDNVPENYITNSWAFKTADFPSDGEIDEYVASFRVFYNTISTYLGQPIAATGHEMKFYDLEQLVPPNYPIAVKTWDLSAAPSEPGLPSEVALCLSFQGEKVPGFPQARRRGRVYLGPIRRDANVAGRPSSGTRGPIAAAATELCADLQDCSNSATLCVWSPSNADAVPVTDGWIDNAWDTQRRRGLGRTERTTWSAS